MRILIVKTSSMGDVVHALPLAADLVAQRSDVEVDWLVEEGFAAIPSMSRHVRRVHCVALRRWRKQPLQRATWREISSVRHALRARSYDLVLDVQGLMKSAWMSRWAAAPVAGPVSGSARERVAALFYDQRLEVSRDLHAVERCRRLGAAALGYVIETPPRFDLKVNCAPAMSVPDPYAVLLVNASRESKLWPEQNWIELEAWLASRGLASVLFWGSETEEKRAGRLVASMRNAALAPRAPIDAIGATMAKAALVIGLDTGLTHLAAALGCATVGIYCDYDPKLVGLCGTGGVESLGGVDRSPGAAEVIAASVRVMKAPA